MRRLFLLIFIALSFLSHGQQQALSANLFLNEGTQQAIEFQSIQKPATNFHSSFRPYLASALPPAADSAVPFKHLSLNGDLKISLKKNLLQILPLVDFEIGYDALTRKALISAGGGTLLRVNINRLTLCGTFVGGTQSLPFFADTALTTKKVLPEFGQAYGTKPGQYNYNNFTGYLSYTSSNKVFNFQAGRDKHFIGEGYRSILLSDFAPALPYIGINAKVWRLQYNVWYNLMFDVENAGQKKSSFRNKYGTFHYLSYNAGKNFNISVFENVVWRGSDTNQARTFDVNYLNPVIFYRPVEFSLHSPDNSFLGLNLSGNILHSVKLYGQLGLDEFYLKEIRAHRGWWANKQAWQLGLKYINAFGIKGLKLQAEYNEVRPYTYSHGMVDQNYGHYGMPLANPLGANFKEFQGIILLRKKDWAIQNQLMYALVGMDSSATSASMGQNIFRSYVERPYEYGHYTTQGVKNTILQNHLKYTWYVQPQLNLRIDFGYIQRIQKSTLGYELQNPYIYVAIRSGLWNIYRDF